MYSSFFKKIVLGVCVVGAVLYAAYFLYRQIHPAYVPPAPREEVNITIIPGWNLRQVADYLVLKGFASSTEQVFSLLGKPGVVRSLRAGPVGTDLLEDLSEVIKKPSTISFEGYLAPQTYRVFKNSSLFEVVQKLITERDKELRQRVGDIASITSRVGSADSVDLNSVLTLASIVEREANTAHDQALVADILWRRIARGMPLQVDSSVHYAVDKTGTVFTSAADREINSPWNTYKYKGLPPGPICNPGLGALQAALFPEKNSDWYFLTGSDGKMYYAKTLEGHTANRMKYLR